MSSESIHKTLDNLYLEMQSVIDYARVDETFLQEIAKQLEDQSLPTLEWALQVKRMTSHQRDIFVQCRRSVNDTITRATNIIQQKCFSSSILAMKLNEMLSSINRIEKIMKANLKRSSEVVNKVYKKIEQEDMINIIVIGQSDFP